MLSWITEYQAFLTLGVQAISAIVWLAYLQVFVTSFRRQRRSNIFVNRVAGNRDRAHLLVGNMGAEPIYVAAIIADLHGGDTSHSAIVTDRDGSDAHGGPEGAASAKEAPNRLKVSRQGPLETAQYRDAGSFRDLIERALEDEDTPLVAENVTSLTVTVAAESSHDAYLVAGQQSFWVRHDQGQRVYIPQSTRTRQIRGWRERRHLAKRMEAALEAEARKYLGTDENTTILPTAA
ncbi:hypothetical protein OCH239_03430 [Roseivivax halodurans JCM 10272]|uniref:Uncharacterized protein n=1 Tax=Roseivivax halodurans JCM 10272 TaxID=1449350 RepID=X7EH46_9RHOB|nr:hypothetical protein [Roseivivax halodurans]ETX14423.1 hypothetical protein OCH239_03430 [Roseivivax halodurans JCM 10272]